MQPVDFEAVLDEIIAADPRYARDAYLFLREALDFTQRKIIKSNRKTVRHVSGKELLEGVREYALKEFGPMTLDLLREWRIHSSEDFGNIVFNLVDHGILAKTDEDTREDFKDVYDLEEAFRRPFLPERKRSSTVENQKSTKS